MGARKWSHALPAIRRKGTRHVSLDPQNGAIRALVGGFDFQKSKFNHVQFLSNQ